MASGVRPARRRGPAALLVAVAACVVCCACAASDADAAVERFRQYLRIRTEQPTPDYVAAAAFLQAQAHDIGYAVPRPRASLRVGAQQTLRSVACWRAAAGCRLS
jgi:hypothetical protein